MQSSRNANGGLKLRFAARLVATVTFNVGSQQFVVYRALACKKSKLFDAAFNSELIEGRTQTYDIDDVDPNLFREFVEWLYRDIRGASEEEEDDGEGSMPLLGGPFILETEPRVAPSGMRLNAAAQARFNDWAVIKAPQPAVDRKASPAPTASPATREQLAYHLSLVKLWVLGDRLRSPQFQNHIMRKLKKAIVCVLTTNWMMYAWKNTMPSSQLRRFAVDVCLYQMSGKQISQHQRELPKALLVKLVRGLGLKKVRALRTDFLYRHVRRERYHMVSED